MATELEPSKTARLAPGTRQKQHILALDGLRGVAACAVVLFHRRWLAPAGLHFDSAYLAVDFFFILSGLVIDHAYRNKLGSGLTFRAFALKRIIRLYPLIIFGAALGFILAEDSNITAVPFAMAAIPIPHSIATTPFELNEPSWSIFFELIANAAFALIAFRLSTRGLAIAVAFSALALIVTVAFAHGINVGWQHETLWMGLPRAAFPFLTGMLLNRVRHNSTMPSIPIWALSLVLIATFAPQIFGRMGSAYCLAMVMVVYPCIIIAACSCHINARWQGVAKVSAFISFPIYIIHYPLLGVLDVIMPEALGSIRPAIFLAVTGAIAYGVGHVDKAFRERLG